MHFSRFAKGEKQNPFRTKDTSHKTGNRSPTVDKRKPPILFHLICFRSFLCKRPSFLRCKTMKTSSLQNWKRNAVDLLYLSELGLFERVFEENDDGGISHQSTQLQSVTFVCCPLLVLLWVHQYPLLFPRTRVAPWQDFKAAKRGKKWWFFHQAR